MERGGVLEGEYELGMCGGCKVDVAGTREFDACGITSTPSTPVAISATTSLNSFAVNGLDSTKAGRWAHAQSGRVVVDSQSMTQVIRV